MKILLIRLRLIGDVVFTTPAVRALRQALPDAHLAYLVEPPAAPVVRLNPNLDEVLVIERRRGARRLLDDLQWARRLRQSGYDLVLDFHGGPRGAWLARATGAPRRIGYTIPGRRGVYTDLVPRAHDLRPRHSVENQWDVVRVAAASLDRAPDPARDPVEMPVDPTAAAAVSSRLGALGVGPGHRLVVVHVSAGNPFRRWPEDAFTWLATGLAARDSSRRIILTAGPSDRAATSRIAAEARRRLGSGGSAAVVECDDLDLAGLHALTARAALYVGGDSGPLHVASTTPTPIVGIFGPTLAERSAPWRHPAYPSLAVNLELPCRPCEQRVCLPGDFRCLARLPAATVLDAAERALAQGAAPVER